MVGGIWNSNWIALGTTPLSSNFKVNEFWENIGASGSKYLYQFKLGVPQIQVAEQVRYHYNSSASMSFSCGFRGWTHNNAVSDSPRSKHTNGQAWDLTTNYASIYSGLRTNEFKNPLPNGSIIFISSVYGTVASKSLAYKMETNTVAKTWVHLEAKY